MRSPYYTNEDIESVINDLENETENSMKVALKTILHLLKDARDEKHPMLNVHSEPTDNPKDIIVGGLHINNTETGNCDGCTDCTCDDKEPICNCPTCRDGK